jgi:hypothetical protein
VLEILLVWGVLGDFRMRRRRNFSWSTTIYRGIFTKGLDFFVLLVVRILGLPAQADYPAGNTLMGALVRYRVARGDIVVAVDLGAMLDDGALEVDVALQNVYF